MQERWSTSNAKLVNVEDGLSQDAYFLPEKNGRNANKKNANSGLFLKVVLCLLLLCLLGLSSYLILEILPGSVDVVHDEHVSQYEKIIVPIEEELIPATENIGDFHPWTVKKVEPILENEMQRYESLESSDPPSEKEYSTVAAEVTEEDTSEMPPKSGRLDAIMKELMREVDSSMSENSNETIVTVHDKGPADRDVAALLIKLMLAETVARMAEAIEREEEAMERGEEARDEDAQSSYVDETTEMVSDPNDSVTDYGNDNYEDYDYKWEFGWQHGGLEPAPYWKLSKPTSVKLHAGIISMDPRKRRTVQ
ncbi:uncharacterized protein LOC144476144 [Augochlora pura]